MSVQRDGRQRSLQLLRENFSNLRVDAEELFPLFPIQFSGLFKPLHQLAHDMLGIGCGAAVSGDKQLAAGRIAFLQNLICSPNGLSDASQLRIAFHEYGKLLFYEMVTVHPVSPL